MPSFLTKEHGFTITTMTKSSGTCLQQVNRFQCVECGEILDILPHHGANEQPESIANRAKKQGWHVDARRKTRCWCPKCAGPSRANNDPDSELRKVAAKMAQTAAPTNVSTIAPTTTPRPLSSDERAQIRTALDNFFDDKIGAYIEGRSDESVAAALNVPRIHVETMREAAYGPIRVDPIWADLNGRIDALKSKLDALETAGRQLRAEAMEIGSKIAKHLHGKA